MRSFNLVFNNFYEPDPTKRPKEFFLTTYAPESLVARVISYYARLRPELPRLYAKRRAPSVYLDVHGSVVGQEMVEARTPRGYVVSCPLSHAHAVCSVLREGRYHRIPPIRNLRPFVLVNSMFGVGALYEEDVDFVADAFSARAAEGAALYEGTRLQAIASGHILDGRPGAALPEAVQPLEVPSVWLPGTRVRVIARSRPPVNTGEVLEEGWSEKGGCLVLHDDGAKYGWGWKELALEEEEGYGQVN